MNKAEKAGVELRKMEDLAEQVSPVHALSALSKLTLTVVYILVVVSFQKYDIGGLWAMIFFPLAAYQISEIPVRTCFRTFRVVLPLVCAVGLLNPIFDREILMKIGNVEISGGCISMLTLMLKGIYSLMASFLLAATTPIEAICAALRRLHVPRLLTTLLLLTYRYISVLLEETGIMLNAYHLRAPLQKGIHVSAWGSFLGQLILRSMDRAQSLYESMILRGFSGEYPDAVRRKNTLRTNLLLLLLAALIILMRFFNIPALIGSVITRLFR